MLAMFAFENYNITIDRRLARVSLRSKAMKNIKQNHQLKLTQKEISSGYSVYSIRAPFNGNQWTQPIYISAKSQDQALRIFNNQNYIGKNSPDLHISIVNQAEF
jgi:hypothetical protein